MSWPRNEPPDSAHDQPDAEGVWLEALDRAERGDFAALIRAELNPDLPSMPASLRRRWAELLRRVQLTTKGRDRYVRRDYRAFRAQKLPAEEAKERTARRWRFDVRSINSIVNRSGKVK